MLKEIIAYCLLLFGVIVAIIGTVYYLRMYKAMNGHARHKSTNEEEQLQKAEGNQQ